MSGGGPEAQPEGATELVLPVDPEAHAPSEASPSPRRPPPPAPARPAWWRRGTGPTRSPGPFVVRAMAYEVFVVLFTALALGVLAYVGLQGQFTDLYLRLRGGPAVTSGEVTVVTVGREALYLWDPADPEPEVTPRGLLAELVEVAEAGGARVVVLDFLLDRPAEGDERLAAAAASHGRVLAAERFESTSARRDFVPATSATLGPGLAAGFANLQAEATTLFSDELLVRKAPLVRRVARAQLSGSYPMSVVSGVQEDARTWPAMALLAAWRHRNPDAPVDALLQALEAGCPAPPASCGLDLEALGLPGLPGPLGESLTLNYRGPEGATGIPEVSAAQLLRVSASAEILGTLAALEAPEGGPPPVLPPLELPEELGELLRDRVVIIGRTDLREEGGDRFVTPYAWPLPMRADMDGVRIQAQLVDTLLSGRHVRTLGGAWGLGLALLLSLGVFATRRVLREDLHALGWTLVGCVLVAGAAALFIASDGLALELAVPLAALYGSVLWVHLVGWAIADHDGTDEAATAPEALP